MEKTILFPQLQGFAHGGDYNPDQWLDRPDILKEDIRLMKKAGINCVSLGIFAWSVYEPSEGDFHFDWMEKIMDELYENGIYTILATPSGARPAWLDAAYPEAMRVSRQGFRNRHGGRHNHCMTSEKYREKTAIIDRKLAERFGSHPGLIMYHISNEFGGDCYCPKCVKRFQEYLAEKFDNDIDRLNKAWWTAFWSHRYNSFDQVEPPFENGENSILALKLEWRRFTTWSMNDFMKHEIRVLKEVTPRIPVTANLMELFNGLDYRKMAGDMDVISWDSYPRFHNDYESFYDTMAENAFNHTLMRSMKREKPFMLMESAPGLVNWHPVNKMKRPGVHKLACMQAVACGSDTVQYFQIRKGRGAYEQFHGAVIDHLGTDDTRVFREVAEVGDLLKKISSSAGTLVKAKTALLFDWDNRWAIQDVKALSDATKNYEKTCIGIWKEFLKMGVEMDIVGSQEDLSQYGLVIAPMLYLLQPGTAVNLKEFAEKGGVLLSTYFTGYVDENELCYLGGFPGDGLSELFGIVSEEIDTLYPGDRNYIRMSDKDLGFVGWKTMPAGETDVANTEEAALWEVRDYAEVLRVKDAEILGTYTQDYYQGMAALTCKTYGAQGNCRKGKAYYMAARVSPEAMRPLFKKMLAEADIPVRELPENVEYHVREGAEGIYEFYLNHGTEPKAVQNVRGLNMETGKEVNGALELGAYGTAVVRK